MKNFKGPYSKTYADQTLILDNVKYHLANNKKTLVKVNGATAPQPIYSATIVPKNTPIVNKHRTLKQNAYLVNNNQPHFKHFNKSKFRLILKKPNNNQFKFIRLNSNNQRRQSISLYKKAYNTVPKNDQIQQLRKRAVKSSINCLIRKNNSKLKKNNKLKLTSINTTYCMFFCRFGRCTKMDTCKYKHDKDKVAICKNFLKGKCEVNECLLSHKIDPKKMPVCSFYLKGICNIENCPYRHVNVNVNAKICQDFVRGFCDKGDQCKLLHQYVQSKCRKCDKNKGCECRKNDKKKMINGRSSSMSGSTIETRSSEPILIDLSVSSDSNMEISDDDNCDNRIVNDHCLDFIPLYKDPETNDVEDGQRSQTPNEMIDSNDSNDFNEQLNYDSDDTWFEDDGKNEFFQYIPDFLLD